MTNSLEIVSEDCGLSEMIALIERDGGTIISGFLAPEVLDRLNRELDPHVAAYQQRSTQIEAYDDFLGAQTVRLHGICAKAESFPDIMIDQRILSIMDHFLLPHCSSYRLSAAELIEIHKGETAQSLHRDDASWHQATWGASPLVLNVMIALTDYTPENGATVIVPQSHRWDIDRKPEPNECAAAVMEAGDATVFLGNLIHGGGSNTTESPRRGLSVSYCLGWLRPVETSFLTVPLEVVKTLPEQAQALLGFDIYDGTSHGSGMIGMYEVGSPRELLR